uniref:Uncharacterized protein n=1 Tax=Avena sativa TaxID=4498 RepID=A0ACD5X7U3_AVESA
MRGRTRTEEVPAVVTVATGALGPVIAKLADLLGSKYYRVRRKTRKDINFIKSKFKSMHSLFWNIWESEDFDAASKELKKEALDLADDVDDAIDDFILSMERSRGKLGRYIQIQTKTNESPFEDFKRRVNDVWEKISREESMVRQKTAQPFCGLFPRKDIISSPTKPTVRAPFVRKNASKVGDMERATVELISYLVGGENTIVQPQLRMATIVGPAGLGKTTLANMVYEEIEDQFQSRAFVSISPSPNMKEVLTSILQQVAADTTVPFATTQAATEERLINEISNFLKNRRYLVVIDDVWHCKEWETIRKCLPENNLASRIVTTTRINALANKWRVDFHALFYHINTRWDYVSSQYTYRLGSEDFNYQDVKVLKTDMVPEGFDWTHEVVYMCASMPLALVCMFSAVAMGLEEQEKQGLSRETSDVQDMIKKQITQNGIQNTPGFEPLVESLQLGYNDLPHHMLKTCLLYCSIYPWGFEIERDDLVRKWIAENFVDTEEAGNNYLDELVSRGLIQPINGILKNTVLGYMLHPMMRNFLRWKLCEDTFITCSSHIPSSFARGSRTHRLCIDDYQDDYDAVEGMDPLFGLDWSHVRSLVVLYRVGRVPLEKLERLRVLHLQQTLDAGNHHLKDICRMRRLRHLVGLKGREIGEIPPEIATLQYLETLDVWGTGITELPREIGDLQNLKTLRIRGTKITELPREIIMRLKKLKTLDISENREIKELPKEIGELQQLKTLIVSGTEIAELPKEIGGLQHLTTLNVSNNTKITELPNEIWKLRHLENLNLNMTYISELPSEIGNLENLETLDLSWTEVTKIPREIWGLKKLKILESKTSSLPWEAGQLSKLVGVPDCVRQAWEKSDLVVELAGEILNFTQGFGEGLVIGTSHMHIPQWIKEHFNNIGMLDIRICKLEEEDLRILREMPNLFDLSLRFEVVPRTPIAISSDGFARLDQLRVDSGVPRVTFQEGAMPMLVLLTFEFRLYGGPPNRDPIGINHLTSLQYVHFTCNNEWYRAQERSCSCISATIDIVTKEAREHRKLISLFVNGREMEEFPANDIAESSKDNNEAWRSGPSEIDELSSIGTAEIDELSSIGTAEMDELSSVGTAEMDEEILHKFGHLVEH